MYHGSTNKSIRRVRPKSAMSKTDQVPKLQPGTVIVDFSAWATPQKPETGNTSKSALNWKFIVCVRTLWPKKISASVIPVSNFTTTPRPGLR